MSENNSPWIKQLRRVRPIEPLNENLDTDVVIIGGGIAGVTTAFFTLLNTKHNVVLLEANKIAHGATGHNAGQITSYFEKPFREIVAEYGMARAARAQKGIEEDARTFLEKIISHAQLTTPHSEFVGYAGCTTLEQVIEHLADIKLKGDAGLRVRPMLVAHEWNEHLLIPKQYAGLYTLINQKNILSLLETDDDSYIAGMPFLSGCMNSALFTEELAGYMLAKFKDRFTLRENSPVAEISIEIDEVVLRVGTNIVSTNHVVLCTNGFETIKIINQKGSDIDEKFHMEVKGIIGYMAAYKEPLSKPPFASYYLTNTTAPSDNGFVNPYMYVTRRPFEDETNAKHNLVCIGGPETYIPDRGTYDAKKIYPFEISESLENFASHHYKRALSGMDYYWHGLMGYTKSGLRLVGFEPRSNKKLLYNLGCNGVGILTSVFGAERISRLLNGEVLENSVFDPK